jgi:Cytochrome C'
MTRRPFRSVLLGAIAGGLFFAGDATPQLPPRGSGPARPRPKLEAVAETKLLMEGLLQPNFRGLDNHLKQRPADLDTWTFARGQALLIAETGNLLMLRPPKTAGQDAWMERATELRERATRLAQQAAARDPDRCRLALIEVAATCTRCHQTFRVPVKIAASAGQEQPSPRD